MILGELFRTTFRNPREAAAMLARLDLPASAAWTALFAVIALSVLVTEPLFRLAPPDTIAAPMGPLSRYFVTAGFSAALVWTIWLIGGWMGGKAELGHVILVFAWLELLLLTSFLGILVLLLTAPAGAGLAGIGVMIAWVWLQSVLYAAVFGFSSQLKALGAVLSAWIAVYAAAVLLMVIFGAGGTS